MTTQVDLINNLKNNCDAVTFKKYNDDIDRLIKHDFSKWNKKIVSIRFLILNPDIVMEIVNNMTVKKNNILIPIQNTTKLNYINPFNSIFKYNPDFKKKNKEIAKKWNDLLVLHNNITTYAYKTSIASPKIVDSYISYKDLVKKTLELRLIQDKPSAKKWFAHFKFLLFEILIHIKPKRCELRKVHIIKEGEPHTYLQLINHKLQEIPFKLNEVNYIIINNDKTLNLVLNDYKTSKFYHQITETIDEELTQIIKSSLLMYPRKFLFGSYGIMGDNKDDFTPDIIESKIPKVFYHYDHHNSYTTVFQGAFKKWFKIDKLTPSKWRHIFVRDTDNYNTRTMSLHDREHLALMMGTSLANIELVYNNINFED
jgi:hypothetical protein